MTLRRGADGPSNGSGLDELMVEDARRRKEAARKYGQRSHFDRGQLVKNAVDKGNSADKTQDATLRDGIAEMKAIQYPGQLQVQKSEIKAHPAGIAPLHDVQNDRKRPAPPGDGREDLWKKRSWDQYKHGDLPCTSSPTVDEALPVIEESYVPTVLDSLSSGDNTTRAAAVHSSPHTLLLSSMASDTSDSKTGVRFSDPVNVAEPQVVRPAMNFKDALASASKIIIPTIEPQLCKEQSDLVNLILSGHNVFYTGSAGCGKSTVLKAFVRRLEEHPTRPKKVDIIAPTGRAALDINGSTFWTYAGWTPDHMKKPVADLRKAAHGKFVNKRLRETNVLVIDEISMLENHHFERLNQVMQEARGNSLPFGGVQLVVTGDFCQLPPVKPFQYCMACGSELKQDASRGTHKCARHGSFNDSEKWAFCSSAWEKCQFHHVNLTNIHRQRDAVFIAMLQKCRLGIPFNEEDKDLLMNHDCQVGNAVRLFSTREEVRVVNKTAFDRLPTRKRTYQCFDDFRCHSPHLQSKERRNEYDDTLIALRDHRFDPSIELKQGMHVVLLVNLDLKAGLVNGSQGVITGFEKISLNKLPKAADKGPGQGLSHQDTTGVATLTGDHAHVREANIRAFADRAATKEWPIVLFQNRVTQTIIADCRVNELGDDKPYSLLSRTQIPLVAGWAMTVHKSQGMTLNRVVVNLARSFEEGQMYVALSRATSLEGLKVEGLGRQQGRNEQVRQFLLDKFGIG